MDTLTDARVFLIVMGARKVGNALYAWGGEAETEGGYDCSGFVSHILTETNRAWPGFYTGGRDTARGIYRHYDSLGCPDITTVADLRPGCLVFYYTKGKTARSATHVALHVVNVPAMHIAHGESSYTADVGPVAFEAGGSGSAATSPRAALRKSATVRVTATDVHGAQSWVAKDPFFHLQRILEGEIDVDVDAAVGGPDAVATLAEATAIDKAEIDKAYRRINPVPASKYNRAQELAGAWQHRKLPAPLPDYPTDSVEFAVLVAWLQDAHGFSRKNVDGHLGPDTLAQITG